MNLSLVTALEKANQTLEEDKEKIATAYVEIENIAFLDSLTNLWNRRGMVTQLKAESARTRRNKGAFCILMADIDFFKKVNDTFGHDAGDLVIQNISKILKDSCRQEDSVSRWGGEEFLLLINSCRMNEGYLVAEKIRRQIESSVVHYNGKEITFTITIGLAQFTEEKEWEDVIKEADINLYEGKKSGRNKVFHA